MLKKIKSCCSFLQTLYKDPRDAIGAYCNKDLLQSLNNPWFKITFLSVHLLIGLVLVSLCYLEHQDPASDFSTNLMNIFSVVLLVVLLLIFVVFQPLSAIFNMQQEFAKKRYELLVLSSSKASQISWGKFKSFALQNLLIVFSFLPHLGLVYFNSDFDVVELLLGFSAALLSMQALVCIGLGMGCCKSFWGKLVYLISGVLIGSITINLCAVMLGALFMLLPSAYSSGKTITMLYSLFGTIVGYIMLFVMNMSWINSKLNNQLNSH